MTDQQFVSAQMADAFHVAFAKTYVAVARQKYPRLAGHLPFHGQDVHIIHGGNRWWHVMCLPGQRVGDIHLGPVGRYTMQGVDPVTNPDLADLPDQNSARKDEFRLAMAVDFLLYHEAFAPPWPSSQDDVVIVATTLAERLVEEHAAPLLELEMLKSKLATMRNSHQLLQDIEEALACLFSERYRAATVTMSAAAESAVVGRIEELGHPIRQEERAKVLGHEHHSFSNLVAEIYRRGVITSKTRDRLEVLNSLRRGIDHCRPDATSQDDAYYVWATLQQLLREMVK